MRIKYNGERQMTYIPFLDTPPAVAATLLMRHPSGAITYQRHFSGAVRILYRYKRLPYIVGKLSQ
jgi:hypothetical protein